MPPDKSLAPVIVNDDSDDEIIFEKEIIKTPQPTAAVHLPMAMPPAPAALPFGIPPPPLGSVYHIPPPVMPQNPMMPDFSVPPPSMSIYPSNQNPFQRPMMAAPQTIQIPVTFEPPVVAESRFYPRSHPYHGHGYFPKRPRRFRLNFPRQRFPEAEEDSLLHRIYPSNAGKTLLKNPPPRRLPEADYSDPEDIHGSSSGFVRRRTSRDEEIEFVEARRRDIKSTQ